MSLEPQYQSIEGRKLKSVVVMLGSYNGGLYLDEQLASINAQTHRNWRLVVSDDGSTDESLDKLRLFSQRCPTGQIEVRQGPRQGFCQNFLQMACDPAIRADYYAFSDQDDVWMPHKLQRALDYLETVKDLSTPHLYCGRTAYVRGDLQVYGYSPLFVFPRSFRNALIQSIAGGNTMVFNQAAKDLLEAVGPVPSPSHDWWLYQLVTGAGGEAYYDPEPALLYRQHPQALVGGNTGIRAKIKRLVMVYQGQFKRWSDQNIESLRRASAYLTDSNRETLELFALMREAGLKDRFRLFKECGLYRQTWQGTWSLKLAALCKKI